ncbi:MAG: bifunctional UDP-N-acetylglucosamine diphosphorylase/glucosamine-1-phosphate N-acetyltransferase GlmU [Rhodospirillales bacterium]|jgi:bifunctional UDP-N-acetylglucosamine pyrophosphorylase/glucosamine-1-phosphate N-acetyltransferase|nr:bifunctional UDP-N-acetylglucosamine diphosphorylase/glucosamine-1-phosphate N-acetyltransferase GlmU [Rhodospirillales bacterium]MDP6806018.1 bifunctional UDP-N-acetylglucosamine diphosphorylase/glucosamine-1-phosphate N-acetyltransferase GlmU [Rhodospirillales bacterium]
MARRQTAVIVLAAGAGTRMRSDVPKVLHPIAGRPMIAYVMETLTALAPERIVVVVGPGMEAVAQAVAPHACVVQKRPLGTGHAVMAAERALRGFTGDVVVVYGADPLISPASLRKLIRRRRAAGDPACVVLGFHADDPGSYGRLVVGAGGMLDAIVEAREASSAQRAIRLCNAGAFAADGRRLFRLLRGIGNNNAKGEYYLTDVVVAARRAGHACAFVQGDASEAIGVDSRADLARAEAAMQARLRARAQARGATLIAPETVHLSFDTRLGRDVTVGPNVVFGPGVTVGAGAEIRAFCHIEGARVAARARVGPFARLRPGAVIGAGAHVGNFVEIKNAIVADGAKANHLAYVGDARIGPGANVGAGVITCNYDGFAKHHTEIGAGAFIGSNAVLVAPVSVGEGAYVGAGSAISKDVPAGALALTRAELKEIEGWTRRKRARRQRAAGPKPKG